MRYATLRGFWYAKLIFSDIKWHSFKLHQFYLQKSVSQGLTVTTTSQVKTIKDHFEPNWWIWFVNFFIWLVQRVLICTKYLPRTTSTGYKKHQNQLRILKDLIHNLFEMYVAYNEFTLRKFHLFDFKNMWRVKSFNTN